MVLDTDVAAREGSQLKDLADRVPAAICAVDHRGIVLSANKAVVPLTGYQPEDLEGANWWQTLYPGDLHRQIDDLQLQSSDKPTIQELVHETRHGARRTAIWGISAEPTISHGQPNLILVGIDVTDPDWNGGKGGILDRVVQRVLSAILQVSLLDIGLEAQLRLILQEIVSVPWIALESRGAIFLVEDAADTLVMKADYQMGEPIRLACAKVPFGKCLCGRAASAGTLIFADCVDERHDTKYPNMHSHGHYCVPIRLEEQTLGVMNLYLQVGHKQDKNEVLFLRTVADVVAGIIRRKKAEDRIRSARDELELRVSERTQRLAIANEELRREVGERVRAEEEARAALAKLQRAFQGTIEALAATVETRDPYTAGHQKRAAQLACAIAREMGLSEEQRGVIRLAASIHDIGKISVPAEILSKPGALTEPEMGVIRVHPKVGYEILKGIELPWPLATIVRQHHERVDGSGYPMGLAGDEIMLEARIIAVADVVEAMVSHRPYRAAKGLQEAIAEISDGKGCLYDALVVEACLALLAKRAFHFE